MPATKTTTTASTPPAMLNLPALVITAAAAKYCSVHRKQSCPFSTKALKSHSPPKSEWSEEDWDGNKQRECEKRKIEQQKEEEEERIRQKGPDNYDPPSPIYDPMDKKDTSAPISRKDLNLNYYTPNYKEDVPILTDDLIQKPTPENKEEDKLEGGKAEKEEGLKQQDKTHDLEEDADAEETDMDIEYDDFNDY